MSASSAAPSDTSALCGDPEKCPCCNNPWNRGRGGSSAEAGDFLASLVCAVCSPTDAASPSFGLSRTNLDESTSPSENFYLYANGGWIKQNPIPPGYPNWNTFLALHVQSQEQCKAILQDLENEPGGASDEAAKVALFYKAAMDEDKIEKDGIGSMKPLLGLVDEIIEAYKVKDLKYANLLGQLPVKYGISPFFGMSASPDAKNPDHTICQLSQGGLGLPDRDYYLQDDKQEQRDMYLRYIANMLTLLNQHLGQQQQPPEEEDSSSSPNDVVHQQAQRIFELEKQLALSHMTRTENRDPEATYNKMSIAEVTKTDDFDLHAYFQASSDKKDFGHVNVRNTEALEKTAQIITTVGPEDLRAWLYFKCVSSCAPYLSKAFVDEHFDFYERKLSGTQELKPRWKRAMAWTETAIGEELGKLYCATHFDEECKTRAYSIVEKVRQALEERLKEVEWITSSSTRQEALEKMSKFHIKIGYPNKWIDYTQLQFKGSFLDMVFAARTFDHNRTVQEMNAPTDREKWFMTPQTVNAYYHPTLNEVVFPAAILQHPFFDKNADDSVNFGAMGAVVGHEMTHGFDDKGRKFDSTGFLRDWWTPEDAAKYEQRVQVVVDQAEAFQVYGTSVQGKLTSGENIADLGGLRLALRALQSQAGFDPAAQIDGFTSLQRFFLAWAQCWRQNITKERALQLVVLDPHGPNEMRCNGPLSNITEFHTAFDIAEDSPMFRAVSERVDIW